VTQSNKAVVRRQKVSHGKKTSAGRKSRRAAAKVELKLGLSQDKPKPAPSSDISQKTEQATATPAAPTVKDQLKALRHEEELRKLKTKLAENKELEDLLAEEKALVAELIPTDELDPPDTDREWHHAKFKPPTQFLGNWVWHSETIGLFVMKTDGGKTQWTTGLCLALTHGKPFCDWISINSCRVLYIEGEASRFNTQRVVRTQREALGIGPKEGRQELHSDNPPHSWRHSFSGRAREG
jgi:hypothetical protein